MSVTARAHANKLLTKYCINTPKEIDLEAILYCENLSLKREPLDTCEGKIIFDSSMGIITVNSLITDFKQQRFIIAHEMGHFFNEKFSILNFELEKKKMTSPSTFLPEKNGTGLSKEKEIIKCGFEELYGFNEKKREWEANVFATELLMPEEMYLKEVRGKNLDVRMLAETAKYFNVSLSSAALRYAEIGPRETAVIMCRDGVVKWSRINKDFKYKFLRKGYQVSSGSYASDYFKGESIPSTPEDIPADAWFNECYSIDLKERIFEYLIPFPKYNSVLVLLWMR